MIQSAPDQQDATWRPPDDGVLELDLSFYRVFLFTFFSFLFGFCFHFLDKKEPGFHCVCRNGSDPSLVGSVVFLFLNYAQCLDFQSIFYSSVTREWFTWLFVMYRVFTGFAGVLEGIDSVLIWWSWSDFVVFVYLVSSALIGLRRAQFNWVLPGLTGFNWVLLGISMFCLVLLGFYWVLVGFTGFYWVLVSFTWFY